MTTLAALILTALTLADPGPPSPAAAPAAAGVWAHAGQHALELSARWLAPAGDGVVVVSDLSQSISGVRVDSGLVAWTRKVADLRGAWVVDGVVVVAGAELQGFNADVGTRLWTRPLGCTRRADPCAARVVEAGPTGLWLAEGGLVQSTIVRLDATTGEPLWATPSPVAHARRIVGPTRDGAASSWVAIEEGQAPFTVRFVEPGTGRALGTWTRRVGGVARPASELVGGGRLGLLAIDTRPGDGTLAHVIIVGPDGVERTTRRIAREGNVKNQVVWAGAGAQALVLFVPDPSAGGGQLVSLDLAEPWTATTSVLASWAEPLVAAGRVVLPPRPTGEAPPLWSAFLPGTADAAWSRTVPGLGADVATIVSADHLVIVDRHASPDGQGLVTLTLGTGTVHGIGTAPLFESTPTAAQPIVAALVGDTLVVGHGKALHRLTHLSAAEVRDRLARGAAAGQDPTPILRRLARFGALADGLSDPSTPIEVEPTRLTASPDAEGALESGDVATLEAFRATWTQDLQGTLEGLGDLADRAEGARRAALLAGVGRLVYTQVLATGLVPRDEEQRGLLVGLARRFEPSASSQTRVPSALWAAIVMRIDEPLVAADILGRARGEPLTDRAYRASAQRAVRGIRTSAGALTTTTQREMLVAGLRFFRHLDVVLGAEAEQAAELLDQSAGSTAAAKALAALVADAEVGAVKTGLGPELCALACEAAAAYCTADVDLARCESRCTRSHVVRFTERARAGGDQDPATWFCGP